jgi:hypothetical protein
MLYTKEKNGSTGVFLQQPCDKGTVLWSLSGGIPTEVRTRTSIQVAEGVHMEDEIGRFINHACKPTCEIRDFFVVSLRDLEIDEEVTFNYNRNEDIIASPFKCECHDKEILGAKYNE